MEYVLDHFDPRVNAFGFMDDALQEFVGYMYRDGEVCVPPEIAFDRLGERAELVLNELPELWSLRRYRRLAKAMARTARMGLDGRRPSRLQLSARMSNHIRDRRKLGRELQA